jgi:hypothetical protein
MPVWLKQGSAFPAGELRSNRAALRQSARLIQQAVRLHSHKRNSCYALTRQNGLGSIVPIRSGPRRKGEATAAGWRAYGRHSAGIAWNGADIKGRRPHTGAPGIWNSRAIGNAERDCRCQVTTG